VKLKPGERLDLADLGEDSSSYLENCTPYVLEVECDGRAILVRQHSKHARVHLRDPDPYPGREPGRACKTFETKGPFATTREKATCKRCLRYTS
jgi:hypothetical protein